MTDREHRSDLMAQILDLICDGDVGGALCDLTKRLYRQPSHTLLLPPSFPSSSTLALIVLFIHSSVGVKELCCCFRRLWWRQLQEPVPSRVVCVFSPLNLILFCWMVYLLERFRLSVYTQTREGLDSIFGLKTFWGFIRLWFSSYFCQAFMNVWGRTTQIKLTFSVKFNFFTLFEFLMRKFCSPHAEISSN